ncbi:MAG: lipoyl synthase [Microthrixaceae bacterium]
MATADRQLVPPAGADGARGARILHTRWLGLVDYHDALALQRGIHRHGVETMRDGGRPEEHLLLLEHPHTYTLGRNADPRNVLVEPASVGAALVQVDRGGDVTYHGPGQLVAYPLVTLDRAGSQGEPGVATATPIGVAHWVNLLEDVLISVLGDFSIVAQRREGYPGVWVLGPDSPPAKIAAVGVRVERGRSLHGIALNVAPDLSMFDHIVPCGIRDAGVTSMAALGVDAGVAEVAGAFATCFAQRWGVDAVDRSDVVSRRPHDDSDLAEFSRRHRSGGTERTAGIDRFAGHEASDVASPGEQRGASGTSVRLQSRLDAAGVTEAVPIRQRKPAWMRQRVHHGPEVMGLKRTMGELDLVTVCEEAGCPNLSECWSSGTATFMVNGERCTRACGFCLVDTRRAEPSDPGEPERVAEAVGRMGLRLAVVTTVARDDLPDEGAGQIAATIRAIRGRCPDTAVEVLISDCRGRAEALAVIFDEHPDVLNHNIETVARLQRAARPSAGYARSLSVLARSVDAGLVTKSGLVLGMGETRAEVRSTLADLASVGVSIVTIGQYLRPTVAHLPVAHWWTPEDFEEFALMGRAAGIEHVESSPFTRSSYHAAEALESLEGTGAAAGVS